MEKKDFPKGTKPREIFVYTCERIAAVSYTHLTLPTIYSV